MNSDPLLHPLKLSTSSFDDTASEMSSTASVTADNDSDSVIGTVDDEEKCDTLK